MAPCINDGRWTVIKLRIGMIEKSTFYVCLNECHSTKQKNNKIYA